MMPNPTSIVHRQRRPRWAMIAVFAGASWAVCTLATWAAEEGAAEEEGPRLKAVVDAERKTPQVDFKSEVQPILKAHCYECHGSEASEGGLRLDQRKGAFAGGDGGAAITPGQSDKSPVLLRLLSADEDERMPQDEEPLDAGQIAILKRWIDQGAHWPAGAEEQTTASDHWSYQPLVKPNVPVNVPGVKNTDWVNNPIDAFVAAKLTEKGLSPSPPAQRRTLIRRVTLDLTGLLPTPEQVRDFLADSSPLAYTRLVDRLLGSPRHGERWARHWMDVVHYGESHGHDQDRPRPNAWPYRDYLIGSFNSDKPYSRFVEEQLAGDVLYPGDPQGIIATGFITTGPWDESSLQSIADDTFDKKIARYIDRDDMITTTMSTFVSSTVHCARCHSHKFDPISQMDYYSLQAVFAGVDRAERSYDADRKTALLRRSLLSRKRAIEAGKDLLSPPAQQQVALWEAGRQSKGQRWVTLDPTKYLSASGARAVKQSDGSVLFTGLNPAVDTYTFVANTDLEKIVAVRLEVLADESLSHKGPGRQDNGNLHLSEFRVESAPRSDPAAKQQLTLYDAAADYDQPDWTAAMAIDGKPDTAWGIYPQVGKSHEAVFEVKDPMTVDGGCVVTFTLEQKHGGSHLIGRPRLSVSSASKTERRTPIPKNITDILALESSKRSDAQRTELARFVLLLQIDSRLAKLPPKKMVFAAAHDFKPMGHFKPAKQPRPIHVLRRGDIHHPLKPASPGAISCIADLKARFKLTDPKDEGSRRAALAQWLSSPKNVLTWRSIVNRVWHNHFGRGLVDTPNDFGHMGSRPTHPELLDWLAVKLLQEGGSIKQLHRRIVTSATYMQSSGDSAAMAKIDAGNRYLWRMNRRRLDAESIRDSMLQITGKIDLTMGGPSAKQFIQSPGVHVTPKVDYLNFDVDSPQSYRRSVYRFVFRTMPDPFLQSLDYPDASQLAPKRNASVTALQALSMLNNRFTVRQSEHFAARISRSSDDRASDDLPEQIQAAYRLALGRPATAKEVALLGNYAAEHGMANVCRLIFNTNEFMFVD